jgi:hypothetical protein
MSNEIFRIVVGEDVYEIENSNGPKDASLYKSDPLGNFAAHLVYAVASWSSDEKNEELFDGYMKAVFERECVESDDVVRWINGMKEFPSIYNLEHIQRIFKIADDMGNDT